MPHKIEWREKLDEFVRDLTKVGWTPKSLAKQRLIAFINSEVIEALIEDAVLEVKDAYDKEGANIRTFYIRQQLKELWLSK